MHKLIILIFCVIIASCATARDIVSDRMNSKAEVVGHVRAECTHLSINDTKCDKLIVYAVKVWELQQYNLDSESIKRLVIVKLLKND
jgi:hypothetical protein